MSESGGDYKGEVFLSDWTVENSKYMKCMLMF